MKKSVYHLLNKIKNAQLVKKSSLFVENDKISSSLLNILWDENYILGFRYIEPSKKHIEVLLKYAGKTPAIRLIKFISKPGRRIYLPVRHLWHLKNEIGLIILSTNKGLLSLENSRRYNIGGELLFIIK